MSDDKHDDLPAGVLEAKGIEVTGCDCPSVWIRFLDENDKVFAVACMPVDVAAEVAANLAGWASGEFKADKKLH